MNRYTLPLPYSDGSEVFCYAVKIHPHLAARPDEIVTTVMSNVRCRSHLFICVVHLDVWAHRKFVSLVEGVQYERALRRHSAAKLRRNSNLHALRPEDAFACRLRLSFSSTILWKDAAFKILHQPDFATSMEVCDGTSQPPLVAIPATPLTPGPTLPDRTAIPCIGRELPLLGTPRCINRSRNVPVVAPSVRLPPAPPPPRTSPL